MWNDCFCEAMGIYICFEDDCYSSCPYDYLDEDDEEETAERVLYCPNRLTLEEAEERYGIEEE